MSCITSDFYIVGDDKGKLKKAINEKVVSVKEKYVIAKKINDGSFHKWAYENVESYKNNFDIKKNINDVDGNIIKKAVRLYQQYLFPKVNNSSNINTGSSLDGFTSAGARYEAIKHTGNLIRDKYQKQFELPEGERKNNDEILVEVANDIIREFSSRVKSFIEDLREQKYNFKEIETFDSLYKEYKDTIKRQKEINKELLGLRQQLSETKDKNERTNIKNKVLELNKEKETIKNSNALLQEKIFALEEVIVDKYNKPEYNDGWRQLNNYTSLYNRVKINNNGNSRRTWFEDALTTSNMLNFAREFKQALESDKLTAVNSEDESTIENDNAENVDETTKNWEDVLASSYNNLYSTKLKMILDSLYDLNYPISINEKGEEDVSYNTDNELGIRTNKGYNFYIQQLQILGNYSSPDALMEAIREKAYNIPELYALSKLYLMMKNNNEFKNYIFTQLKTPLIKKAIIELRNNGVDFAWSNEDAFNGSNFYFTLYHQLKLTYKSSYNINTLNTASSYRDALNAFKNSSQFNNSKVREEIYNFIINYFHNYFPNIENSVIDEWLFGKNNSTFQTFKDIINNIISIERGLDSFITIQNLSDIETNNKLKEWHKLKDAANEALLQGQTIKLPSAPTYQFQEEAYNKAVSVPLQNLTSLIIKNVTTKVDLNHANGENKLASDLINNSYITNILELIKTGTVDAKTGLNKLFKIVSQSDQYSANPIFFGLKDRNGKYRVHGIFDVEGEISPNATYSISNDASNILDFILFDGIKDVEGNTGTVYSKMGKSDYLITQLIAFKKQFNNRKNVGGLFTRIPSDAGKNFIAETIKYKTNDLYLTSGLGLYRQNLTKEINEKYKDKYNIKEERKSLKNIRTNPKKYSVNNISKEQALDILTNGGINNFDYSSYMGYTRDNETNEVIVPLIINTVRLIDKVERQVPSFVIFIKGKTTLDNRIIEGKIESINSLYKSRLEDLLNDYTNVSDEIYNLINAPANNNIIEQYAVSKDKIEYQVNTNNDAYLVIYNQIVSEIKQFVNQLNNVFVWDGRRKTYITRTDTNSLYDVAQYKGSIVKDGKLTGGFFKFKKLFNVNGKDYSDRLFSMLSLYGGTSTSLFESITYKDKTEGLKININRINTNNDFIKLNKSNDRPFSFQETKELRNSLDKLISEWLTDYRQEINNVYSQYKVILDNAELGTIGEKQNFIDWSINSTIANMCFDDILEGSTAFYKDSQTFLKRAKEVQMSGKAFASNVLEDPFGAIKSNRIKSYNETNGTTTYNDKVEEILIKQRVETTDKDGNVIVNYEKRPLELPCRENGSLTQSILTARNGFRAISIKNTVRPYDQAEDLYEKVYQETLKKVNDEELAKNIANGIADGYRGLTIANDAQSYITLDEFIRRRYLDGTLNEYQDLLAQLLDDKVDVKDIDLKEVNSRIQVQKNVYYDITFDNGTRTYVPRQIKNAEFVLIPKLLPKDSDLYRLYQLMHKYDINQINTEETLKAGKKNVLTLWDNEGNVDFEKFEKELQNDTNTENYYYQYLYKQQDVVNHIEDERNKFGIQIAKKIQDNTSTSSDKVKSAINSLQRNYVANIKSSFDKLLFSLGFNTDENGTICNRYYSTTDSEGNPLSPEEIKRNKYTLNFKEFYSRARTEAQRLGMDSNFMDYLTPDSMGVPSMPNWYNISSIKLESIAQSIFNSMIARQTLPGWHSAQVTNVGYSKNLKYHPDVYSLITNENVKIDKEEYDELSDEEKNKYKLTQEAYMEVYLPRWSKLLPQRPTDSSMSQEEFDKQLLKQLEEEGLDLHIGYRIPTEGKQSVSILKVKGFLNEAYGSTIIVPDSWVTQTGSDFDVDTIYGIEFEFYRDRNGKFKMIKSDDDTSDDGYQRRYIAYVNDLIKERKKSDNSYQNSNIVVRNALSRLNEVTKVVNEKRPFAKAYKEIKSIQDKEDNEKIKRSILSTSNADKKENLSTQEIYEHIVNKLSTIINTDIKKYYTENQLEDIKRLIDLYNILIDQYRIEENNSSDDSYSNFSFKDLKELRDNIRKDYFDTIEEVAKSLGIISFEDFVKLPLEEQQNQKARNNAIVQAMIDIMKDPTTLEENLSRSNFDDIGEAKKELESIDSSLSFNSMSPYSPFTQLQFFENAINGRKLKAFSVDRDTFTSLSNKIHTVLRPGHEIIVEYDADKYNKSLLDKNYGEVETITRNNKTYYRVKHNKLGWSYTNRNVVGKLITTYSSETTAHILDAIKMGALYNETDFTFGTFKTLIDVGIDYQTAVMFLAQPAVTLINGYNFQKQSIYVNNNLNPIDSALKDIAAKINIKVNNKSIDQYTKTENVLSALRNNQNFMYALSNIFSGSNLNDLSSDDINIILNKNSLTERLKQGQSTQSYTKDNGEIDYEKAAFDIGMVLAFKKFYNTTKVIEQVSRLSNPDSFGARQTVHETRVKLNNIQQILVDYNNKVNKILSTEDNTTVLESIYPNGGESIEKIDPYKSKYPYLAAMLKYATYSSVKINSNLFRFEHGDIVEYINNAQGKLGIVFNEDQYNDFKKYIVSNIFYSIELLSTPLKLNEFGFITPDAEGISKNNKFNYWDDEIARVFGYKEYNEDVVIKDKFNPTNEEIENFIKLTPLQKVIWIQKNFDIRGSIFEIIKTYKYSGRTNINNSFNNNVIKYNDTVYNQEDILNYFEKAFFNSNPLIKLTAIDLIKYAFLVEGFNFKKGSISKIIKNNTIKNFINQKGLNIVSTSIDILENKLDNYIDDFTEKFVRSHPEITKEIKFGKTDTNNTIFNNLKDDSGLVFIPFTSDYSDFRNNFIVNDKDKSLSYIRIRSYSPKGVKTQSLYKIYRVNSAGIYLIPLNLLNRNEVSNYSINSDNNKHYTYEYYQQVIENADVENSLLKSRVGEEYKAYIDLLGQRNKYKVPVYNYYKANSETEDYNYIIDLLNSDESKIDNKNREQLRKFIKDIESNKQYFTKDGYVLVWNESPILSSLLKDSKGRLYQNISINGENRVIEITKYKHNLGVGTSKKVFTEQEINIRKGSNGTIETRIVNPKVYKISILKEETESKSFDEDIEKAIDEKYEDNPSLISGLKSNNFSIGVNSLNKNEFEDTDKVGKYILDDIYYREIKNNEEEKSDFFNRLSIQGINRNSLKSINENKKSVYVSAAKYYKNLADQLIYEINNFTIGDEKFKINSENLYTKLMNNPEDAIRLIKLMLEAKTFGRTIDAIFNLDITSEDEKTQDAINSIKQSINRVKDNTLLKKAFDNIFNIYFMEQYSNNPLYSIGISSVTDSWRDANFFELNIGDIRDLNNKEVQIIVKAIGTIISKSRFDAENNVKNFKENFSKLLKLEDNFDWKHIIDKDGRLIHEYTDKFISDKKDIREKVSVAYVKYQDAIKTKDMNKIISERINLEKVLLEKDEWFAKNIEQEVVVDYYNRLNTARKKILEIAPRQYAEYKVLGDLINKNYADVKSLSEKEREERHNYFIQRSQLISHTYSDGTEKEGVDSDVTIALNEYLKNVRELSEQYFEYEPTEDFKNELKENLKIIEEVDLQHPDWTIEEKLNKNERYYDAYYWLKNNARRKITKDVQELINEAFSAIKSNQALPNNNPLNTFKSIYSKIDNYDQYDAFGVINGLAFEKYVEEHPDDDIIQQMHDITDEINNPFNNNRRTEHPDHILSDNNLIKEIPSNLPVFNDAFYSEFRGSEMKDPQIVSKRFEIMAKINRLISNAVDPKDGHISSERLFKNLSEDELKELGNLYQQLRTINRSMIDNLDKATKNKIFKKDFNEIAFNREKSWFDANVKNNALRKVWIDIFCEKDSEGNIKLDDSGNFIPNNLLFGYYIPKKKFYNKYVDKNKTRAKQFIHDNIRYVKTQYYYDAQRKHIEKGDYDTWYKKNHYYNPYTHTVEPLRIWTVMEVNPSLGKNGTYEYTPTFNNQRRTAKKTNPKYRRYSTNYNSSTGEYTNSNYINLSDKEKEIVRFIQSVLNQTASSNSMRQWFEQGFMPRKYRPNIDAEWIAKNIIGSVGLEISNSRNLEWHDYISYEKDFDADFDMTRELRTKGYEEYKKPEKQLDSQTDSQYKLYLQQIDKENAEIRKRNLEREKTVREEDWEKVLEEYIARVTEYKARTKSKDLIYLLLEDLRSRQSYKTTAFGNLSRRRNSPVEEEWYSTIPQTNTIKIVENYARRILFEEYKKPNPTRDFADLMQNITSAKYMIFNVTGGISNVTTGLVNIMGEVFAGQFFNHREFRAAQEKYFSNAISFISSMWSEDSPNLTVALAKRYGIVDFDAMVERKPGENAAEWAERTRNLLYGLQSGGEHYMQNTVLFAVLKSHRIFRDMFGKYVIGNFNDYTINIDYIALKDVIKDNPEFTAKLDIMKKDIKRNKDLQREYDLYQRDFCQDFISSIIDRKVRNDIAKKYIAKRNELLKNAREEFNKFETVEDQYEFSDGKCKLKKDSKLTTEMEGFIKNRVQTINTQIHGVYDKLGGARIESEWWGGLIMQYHKHIYPGIMKRYRRQGYFNEVRGIVNQGSYYSLWNLFTKDFNGIKKRIQELNNDGTNIALASLQEIAKSSINCILNLKFNYSTSPVWMQQNMRRALGDLLGITSAIIMALAIYALTDDDDRKDSDLINTGIYLADRLFSESQMYTPWGLPSEANTMWSSPIAAQNGPQDLIKALNYIGQYIFNDEYEPEYKTGLYAGQNKLAVVFKRNIPFYRVINRLNNMSRNNQYYRINENSFNIGIAEDIAMKLKGEE